MKYVIWGAGIRGTRLFAHLGEENVIAFVDKNINMETYCGKPVIDIEEYINCLLYTSPSPRDCS